MSQLSVLPARLVLLLSTCLPLLGGCQGIYDDTKGWANRLEASILEAAHDLDGEAEAGEPARYTPESEAKQTAAMTPMPRPDGTPIQIEPNPAEDLRQDDLLLDELPDPASPPPTKEAGKSAPPAADAVAGAARSRTAEPAAGKTATGASQAARSEINWSEMAGPGGSAEPKAGETEMAKAEAPPPAPKRKPEAPQSAAQPRPDDAVAMVLHLSSLRSEQAAKREWSDLQRSYPEALGSLSAEIRRAELGDKGTFYRVLVGPLPSRSAAKDTCAAVKSKNARQYCRVLPARPQG